MKGLLLKDIYTLIKQMKLLLLIVVIWCCLPGISASSFAIIYAGLLPITALAYDERSKWNTLAAMMPYSVSDIVFSKYLLGYIMTFGAALIACISRNCFALLTGSHVSSTEYAAIGFTTCLGLVFQAVNLPLMFRLGVEKGRLFFIVMVVLFTIGGISARDILGVHFSETGTSMVGLLLISALVVAVIHLISVTVSTKIYKCNL